MYVRAKCVVARHGLLGAAQLITMYLKYLWQYHRNRAILLW